MAEVEINSFFRAVLALKSEDECVQFFEEVLSRAEIEKVKNRWAILLMLHQGLPHREIAERLGVGIATVSRGNGTYGQARATRTIIERLKD